MKNEMKKMPLAEKMAKDVEMKKIQHQVTALQTQQHQRIDKVTELKADEERVIDITQPIH